MSQNAIELLSTFDALTESEQLQIAAEIMRRTMPGGELPEAALDELAAELFRGYDAEEAAHADP